MPITTLPTQTEGSLGGVKSDTGGPYAAATDVRASMVNEWVTRFVEMYGEIGLSDGSTPGSINEAVTALLSEVGGVSLTSVESGDEFDDPQLTGWVIQTRPSGSSASVSQHPSFAATGLIPGSGIALLEVGGVDPNDGIRIIHDGTGLVLDAAVPIVEEWRLLPVGAGAYVDDECEWLIGLEPFGTIDAANAGIFLRAVWSDPGAGFVRTYLFGRLDAAGAILETVAVSLPVLGAGKSYRIRITALTTSAILDAAVDEGAYATIGTIGAPAPAVYSPMAQLDQGDGLAARALAVDFCTWSGKRTATDAGVLTIGSREVVRPPTSATAPLVLADGVVSIDPATPTTAGSLSAADKAFLDGLPAGTIVTDVTGSAPVSSSGGATPVISMPAASAAADGYMSAAYATKLDGIEAGANATPAASDTVAGAIELATSAETITGTATDRAVTPAGAEALHAYARGSGTAAAPITGAFNLASYPSNSTVRISTSGGVATATLPTPAAGLRWTIKDIGGALSTNALTVVRTGTEKIEGVAASYIFGADYGALTLECDGTDWWVL